MHSALQETLRVPLNIHKQVNIMLHNQPKGILGTLSGVGGGVERSPPPVNAVLVATRN